MLDTPRLTPSSTAHLAPRELRQVISLLKSWREIQYQLQFRRDDAIFGGYGMDFEARSRSGRPGNPTQSRALRLATDPETRQLAHLNNALERALLAISGTEGKQAPVWWALRQVYLGHHPVCRVAETVGVSRQTIWRWEKALRVSLWEALQIQ